MCRSDKEKCYLIDVSVTNTLFCCSSIVVVQLCYCEVCHPRCVLKD